MIKNDEDLGEQEVPKNNSTTITTVIANVEVQ